MQNRCPETLWTFDFGYKSSTFGRANDSDPEQNSPSEQNYEETIHNDRIKLPVRHFESRNEAKTLSISESNDFIVLEEPKDFDFDARSADAGEDDDKTNENSNEDWDKSTSTEDENESNNPPKSVSNIVVNLISFIVVFGMQCRVYVYFIYKYIN